MYALVYQINCEGARVHPWQYLIVFFSFRYFFLSVAPKTRFRTFCAGFTATSRITWCCWKVDEWKEQLSVLPTHWDQLQSCHGLRDCEYFLFLCFPRSFICLCLCLSLYAVTFRSVSLLLPVSVFPLVNCSHVLLFLSLHWYMSCSLISALCKHSNCPLCLLHLGSTNFDLFLLS